MDGQHVTPELLSTSLQFTANKVFHSLPGLVSLTEPLLKSPLQSYQTTSCSRTHQGLQAPTYHLTMLHAAPFARHHLLSSDKSSRKTRKCLSFLSRYLMPFLRWKAAFPGPNGYASAIACRSRSPPRPRACLVWAMDTYAHRPVPKEGSPAHRVEQYLVNSHSEPRIQQTTRAQKEGFRAGQWNAVNAIQTEKRSWEHGLRCTALQGRPTGSDAMWPGTPASLVPSLRFLWELSQILFENC